MRTSLLLVAMFFYGAALPVCTTAYAETIIVDVEGAGNFLTIQEGLDAAASGDTVLVYPGRYTGSGNRDIQFEGKVVTLVSRDGMEATTIDLNHLVGPGVLIFDDHESRNTVVDGFTVLAAVTDPGGAGFYCHLSSPTIRNCRFTECSAYGVHHVEGWCGAGTVYSGEPLFEHCMFENNYANSCCGGVCVRESSHAVFRDCVFSNNTDGFEGVGSLNVFTGSSATLENCTFVDHNSCRMVVSVLGDSSVELINCTVTSNGGSVQTLIGSYGFAGSVDIMNCIFAFNDCDALAVDGLDITMAHSCLYETAADSLHAALGREANLTVDPLFCGLAEGDHTLCANSPCLPENNDWAEAIGADGEGCPPCYSAAEAVSWGMVKSLFR